ncbi:N-acetylmannosamine-6-phosphate 2-epimerase [Oceanobacillus sp. FSL H7-0719]|uniref:N-acetylmannosamine-6-phosphate 2-epimerase n=1 Tax=Oceanobacillus sp. FSL H7-0719 TaxID=2954507 RepID=UPI00324E1B8D
MNKKEKIMQAIKNNLVVSCQALPDEALHSSFIMGRMAKAASLGGAKGIRANSVEDIQEIKRVVDLPIIGIIKQVYDGSDVFITPTMKEVEQLCDEGVDIVAIDATNRIRPDGRTIHEVFPAIKEKYPDQLFMADCSCFEDAKTAHELGFDLIGTTLSGYTEETKGRSLPDFELVEQLVKNIPAPIISEGGIWTPEQLAEMFELGVHTAVVGTAITRPYEITKQFVHAIRD